MITARIANEILESQQKYESVTKEILFENIQRAILKASHEGFNVVLWSDSILQQETIDLLVDLGYIVETTTKGKRVFYLISW